MEGFCAGLNDVTTNRSMILNDWTCEESHYWNTGKFSTISGEYIVPSDGLYHVNFKLNYSTEREFISIRVDADVYISINLNNISISKNQLPIWRYNLPYPNMRRLLEKSSLSSSEIFYFNAGDIISLSYNENQLHMNLNIHDTIFSIIKISSQNMITKSSRNV